MLFLGRIGMASGWATLGALSRPERWPETVKPTKKTGGKGVYRGEKRKRGEREKNLMGIFWVLGFSNPYLYFSGFFGTKFYFCVF